ncbi:hypothetical protein HORIV_35370 [Vreelandella olivaria]|uniref:Uncharacterized protein n=1 Tax=Vreelandella olivaria TaxID=390919 RepID=A0ABM7GKK9_9GAMM|nr:hypothetical protein HORIV_35370 [Halomonas olivaria]
MRFGFLNNFAAQLAAPVTDDATEIELSAGAEQIAEALENADALALTLFVRDTQGMKPSAKWFMPLQWLRAWSPSSVNKRAPLPQRLQRETVLSPD